jgi:hypothetical protein
MRSGVAMVASMASRLQISWHATFTLKDADLNIIGERRGDHNRLGFAVQLCTVRFLGTFLEDLSETVPGVVVFLGRQLGLKDPSVFSTYCTSEARWDHAGAIRSQCGLREFSDSSARFRLTRWLYRALATAARKPPLRSSTRQTIAFPEWSDELTLAGYR